MCSLLGTQLSNNASKGHAGAEGRDDSVGDSESKDGSGSRFLGRCRAQSIAANSSVCACNDSAPNVRGRAWLHARLVEGSLALAVDAALHDKVHTASYYTPEAAICHPRTSTRLSSLLAVVADVPLKVGTKNQMSKDLLALGRNTHGKSLARLGKLLGMKKLRKRPDTLREHLRKHWCPRHRQVESQGKAASGQHAASHESSSASTTSSSASASSSPSPSHSNAPSIRRVPSLSSASSGAAAAALAAVAARRLHAKKHARSVESAARQSQSQPRPPTHTAGEGGHSHGQVDAVETTPHRPHRSHRRRSPDSSDVSPSPSPPPPPPPPPPPGSRQALTAAPPTSELDAVDTPSVGAAGEHGTEPGAPAAAVVPRVRSGSDSATHSHRHPHLASLASATSATPRPRMHQRSTPRGRDSASRRASMRRSQSSVIRGGVTPSSRHGSEQLSGVPLFEIPVCTVHAACVHVLGRRVSVFVVLFWGVVTWIVCSVLQEGVRLYASVTSASLQLEKRKAFDPKATVRYHIGVVLGSHEWTYVVLCNCSSSR